MIYSHEVEEMCTVAQGVHHGAAPIPEEAKWVKSKEVKDISGLTHGVGSVSYTHLGTMRQEGYSPSGPLPIKTGRMWQQLAAWSRTQAEIIQL